MKKVIRLSILLLLLPLSISAQAPGGHITRKKTSTTTPAPKKTTTTPKKTTSASKSHPIRQSRNSGQASRSSGATPIGSNEGNVLSSSVSDNNPNKGDSIKVQDGTRENEEVRIRQEHERQKRQEEKNNRIIQNLLNNMVYIEGGTFMMGATYRKDHDAQTIEKPTHHVTLSSFSIGRYEVTQEEWIAVTGSNPSYFKGPKLPVERVSWEDCQTFISKLNAITGRQFRLPTEAEWEYAARGGNLSWGYKFSGSNKINQIAWYDDNGSKKTHEVGTKAPNELGLYDMSGNVWEWCNDYYGKYSSSAQTNPTGPSVGTRRVQRGGCFMEPAWCCRVSTRYFYFPSELSSSIGLRLAL